jgi:hypothetical protein
MAFGFGMVSKVLEMVSLKETNMTLLDGEDGGREGRRVGVRE